MNEQAKSYDGTIQNSIKTWVALDNQYKKLYSQISLLREEKNNIEEQIFNYYDSKNANYPLINISDGKLSLTQMKQYNMLSFKFLEDCFKEFFTDYENCKSIENELIEFIKSKRTFKTNNLIKRTYKIS
uniref:Uncharacterized protein n=1 Tax=viral metagenome TaxID=1070528 RepID=A0A6C0KTG9_9ZZZZ